VGKTPCATVHKVKSQLLFFQEQVVETPQGVLYHGKQSASDKICGVSILRAGETMEQAVCDVCKDIRIGKILIQTNFSTGEPEVSFFFCHVFLQLLVLFLLFLHRLPILVYSIHVWVDPSMSLRLPPHSFCSSFMQYVRWKVCTAVLPKIQFCDVTQCCWDSSFQNFEGS
jgi:Uracil phosphoribosyltransferase